MYELGGLWILPFIILLVGWLVINAADSDYDDVIEKILEEEEKPKINCVKTNNKSNN